MGAPERMPERQGMSARRIPQELNVRFGQIEMANPQGDRTCRNGQGVTQRVRMMIRLRTFDHALDHRQRLLRETLQPQDPGQKANRLLVDMKANDSSSRLRGSIIGDGALEVTPGVALTALIMIRETDHSIRDEPVGRR